MKPRLSYLDTHSIQVQKSSPLLSQHRSSTSFWPVRCKFGRSCHILNRSKALFKLNNTQGSIHTHFLFLFHYYCQSKSSSQFLKGHHKQHSFCGTIIYNLAGLKKQLRILQCIRTLQLQERRINLHRSNSRESLDHRKFSSLEHITHILKGSD